MIPKDRLQDFATIIIRHCAEHCNPLLPNGSLIILLIDDDGNIYRNSNGLFSHLVLSTAKNDGSNHGSSHQCCHTIDGQGTLEAWHTGDKVADKCQQGTTESRGWHQDAMVGRPEDGSC
jgi:hypothetical protein